MPVDPENVPAELPEDVEEMEPEKPNAFSTMMAASSTQNKASYKPLRKKVTSFIGRDALGAYLVNPKTPLFLYENDFAVALRDLYPKGSVHTLLLPRDQSKTYLHPFKAFEDAAFLATVKQHAAELKRLVASELRKKFGKFSQLEAARRDAMEESDDIAGATSTPEIPPGRDWESEVLVGVHAGPSMSHLHIHVVSPDHVSDCVKKRNHYNSFVTPFLVRLEEFPLPPDDSRRKPNRGGWLQKDLVCWRCGRNFGNRFAELKPHLLEELETWKRI